VSRVKNMNYMLVGCYAMKEKPRWYEKDT